MNVRIKLMSNFDRTIISLSRLMTYLPDINYAELNIDRNQFIEIIDILVYDITSINGCMTGKNSPFMFREYIKILANDSHEYLNKIITKSQIRYIEHFKQFLENLSKLDEYIEKFNINKSDDFNDEKLIILSDYIEQSLIHIDRTNLIAKSSLIENKNDKEEDLNNMKKEIFIGWSGDISKQVAEALKYWIPNVLQNSNTWVSFKDIKAGSRWFEDISKTLEKYHFGIFCITEDNNNSTWMHYEAGALSKIIDRSNICPYLIRVRGDIKGPLRNYQACEANREGTYHLMKTINNTLDNGALGEKQFDDIFNTFWPKLESILSNLQIPKLENEKTEEFVGYDYLPRISRKEWDSLNPNERTITIKEGNTLSDLKDYKPPFDIKIIDMKERTGIFKFIIGNYCYMGKNFSMEMGGLYKIDRWGIIMNNIDDKNKGCIFKIRESI